MLFAQFQTTTLSVACTILLSHCTCIESEVYILEIFCLLRICTNKEMRTKKLLCSYNFYTIVLEYHIDTDVRSMGINDIDHIGVVQLL